MYINVHILKHICRADVDIHTQYLTWLETAVQEVPCADIYVYPCIDTHRDICGAYVNIHQNMHNSILPC